MSVQVDVGKGAAAGVLIKSAEALERGSEHPLAAAIVHEAETRDLMISSPREFASTTGRGVAGLIEGRHVQAGNSALLAGMDLSALTQQAEELRASGATALFVAVDGQPAGVIAIADPVKTSTKAALEALRAEGVRIVMLTGDDRRTAEAIARQLGIADVEAEGLPEQKHAVIQRLRREGRVVAMAGDGVNDAPALAAADIGIVMGHGHRCGNAKRQYNLCEG